MPVVINEFEVISEEPRPAPAAAAPGQGEGGTARNQAALSVNELQKLEQERLRRELRVAPY